MSAPRRYSSGTVFVNVVPSFRKTQRDIGREMEKEAEGWGKDAGETFGEEFTKHAANQVKADKKLADAATAQAGQGGQQAGRAFSDEFRSTLNKTLRDLEKIKVDAAVDVELNESSVVAAVAAIRAALEALRDRRIGVDVNGEEALAELAAIRSSVNALTASHPELVLDVDTSAVDANLRNLEERIRRIQDAARHDQLVPRDRGEVRREGETDRAVPPPPPPPPVGDDGEASRRGAAQGGLFAQSFRRAMAGALSDLPDVPLDIDDSEANRRIRQLRAYLEVLRDITIGVDLDADGALAEAAKVDAAMQALLEGDHDIAYDIDLGAATAKLSQFLAGAKKFREELAEEGKKAGDGFSRRFQAQVKAALSELPDVDLDLNSAGTNAKIKAIRAQLEGLTDVEIGVDISGKAALADIHRLQRELRQLARSRVDIQVRTDARNALAELNRLEQQARRTGSGGDDAANSFRAFSGVLLAVITIGPLLVPILAAIAGGLIAIFVALVPLIGMFGVLALGLVGIGEAVGALGDVEKNAAKDQLAAARSIRSAANGIRDAEIGLSRARQDAADSAEDASRRVADALQSQRDTAEDASRRVADALRSQRDAAEDASRRIADALESQQDAQEDLTRAQEDARDAELALQDAREQAADQLKDLDLRIRENALAERQAIVNLFEATVSDTNARQDSAATNLDQEQASIALEQARLNLERLRSEQGELAEEKAEADKTGVEGTETVVNAQEGLLTIQDQLVDAQERVADSARAVADAQRDQARSAQDSALAVADAQRDQARSAEDSARAVADAQRDQARSAQDSAQSISDAVTRMADAQLNYRDALTQAEEIGSASAQRLAQAYAVLGPAGRAFAEYIYGLKPFFTELRIAAQEAILPGLQAGIESFLSPQNRAVMLSFITTFGEALGGLFERAGKALDSPFFREFFLFLEGAGPAFISQFGAVFGNLAKGLASLFIAFTPFTLGAGEGLVDLTERFADWAAGLRETEGFQRFIGYLERTLPQVGKLVGALALAIIKIGEGLAPYSEDLLALATGFLGFLASLDPQVLGVITVAVVALLLAFQLAQAAAVAVKFLTLAFMPVGLIVGGIILFAAAMYLLWKNSEIFRDIVVAVWETVYRVVKEVVDWFWAEAGPLLTQVWKDIQDAVTFMWEKTWRPILPLLWELAQMVFVGIAWAWENILKPVFIALIEIIEFLYFYVVRPLLMLMGLAFQGLAVVYETAWRFVLKPVLEALGAIFVWLWRNIVEPIVGFISRTWDAMTRWIADKYQQYVAPMFRFFGDALVTLQNAVSGASDFIGRIWDGLMAFIRDKYNEYVAPVWIVFTGALDDLRSVFDRVVEEIGVIWNKLIEFFKTPVRFIVDTVINDAVIGTINDFFGLIGVDDVIDPIPAPGGGSWGSWATGGPVGGYSPSPTADNIAAWLTAGEYVQPVATVDYYGEDIMDAMRKRRIPRDQLAQYADGGLVDGRFPFAAGGSTWELLWDIMRTQFGPTGIRLTSAVRPGDPGFHGSGQAVDVAGPTPYPDLSSQQLMREYNLWAAARMPNLTELIHTSSVGDDINLYYGRPHDYSAATQEQHRNHVHLAANDPSILVGGGDLSGYVPGSATAAADSRGLLGTILGFSPIDKLLEAISGSFGPIADFVASSIGSGIAEFPAYAVSTGADAIWSLLTDNIGDLLGLDGVDYFSEGEGDARVRQSMQHSAGTYGWGDGPQWEAIDFIISRESGWNPQAQNPTSSAYGLGQMIDATWDAYKPPGAARDDVSAQISAFLAYVADRYGDPVSARRFWEANNHYGMGGLVEQLPVNVYDGGGGLPPGLSMALNGLGHTETVLPISPTEFEAMAGAAYRGEGGTGDSMTNNFTNLMTDPQAVAAQIRRSQKVAAHAGKYGRSR